MTAINVIVLKDSVTIVSDTKAANPLGSDFNVSKVACIPHMEIALATRGKVGALDIVRRAVEQHAFDYASARAYLADYYSRLGLAEVEVFLIGMTEEGPAACMISKPNTDSKIVDIPNGVVTPTVSQEAFDVFAADLVAGMPELLNRQHEGHSSVGGFVCVTTVRRGSIETYVSGIIDELAWRAPLAA